MCVSETASGEATLPLFWRRRHSVRGQQRLAKKKNHQRASQAATPPPLLCFARAGKSNPDSQLLRLNTQPLWKRPAATRREGLTLQRQIKGSDQRARERTQSCAALLFVGLIVSGGCHVPDDGAPWLAIQAIVPFVWRRKMS